MDTLSASAQRIQEVLRLVDRELWVITAADETGRGGLVATWVAQASLDPNSPLLLIALSANHFTSELVSRSRKFAAHLLRQDQIELVWRFGLSSGRNEDKLKGLSLTEPRSGPPILSECLAWLDCRVVTTYDAGDRIFYWAEVVDGARQADGAALRESEMLAVATDQQLAALRQNMLQDIEIQRPLLAAWKQRLTRQ